MSPLALKGSSAPTPKDRPPLRPSLTSKEILIDLDNAESALDPQGANAVVDGPNRFDNVRPRNPRNSDVISGGRV